MQIAKKILVALASIFFVIVGFRIADWSGSEKITELQNELALKDKTIEIEKNVYHRLAQEKKDIEETLDEKDKNLSRLRKLIKKNKEDVLSSTKAEVKIETLEGEASAKETKQDGRERVDFDKSFSLFSVSGHTLTNPAEAHVKVEQISPLTLSVVTTQKDDGSWSSYAVSSDESVKIDISSALVNPFILERKWYEEISLSADVGVSDDSFLLGAGASYQAGKFGAGPSVYVTKDGVLYGVNLTWQPFRRGK